MRKIKKIFVVSNIARMSEIFVSQSRLLLGFYSSVFRENHTQ
jgi:hypothetical protein